MASALELLILAKLAEPPWIAMGSLLNSWSNTAGSNVTAQYRLWTLTNEVEVIGDISHASISATSTFFTLPAGFLPVTAQRKPLQLIAGTSVGPLYVDGTGILQVVTPSAVTRVGFHAWIPLDA